METRTFSVSRPAAVRAVIRRIGMLTFIGGAASVFIFGTAELFGLCLWFSILGSIGWQYWQSPTVTVGTESVQIARKGWASETYRFDNWYFSGETKGFRRSLIAEHRKSGKKVVTPCSAYDGKLFHEMCEEIRRRQSRFFVDRRRSGDTPKPAAAPTSASTAPSPIPSAAAEASRRNPYSKNYAGRTESEPIKAEPIKAEPIKAEPAKAEPAKAEPAKAAPSVSVPAAGASVLMAGAASVKPEPTKPELPKKTVCEVCKNTAADSEMRERLIFYFPKRAILEKNERANVLSVLWILFAAVAGFLLWLLFAGDALPLAGVALAMAAFWAGILAGILFGRIGSHRYFFEKLEICEDMLIIDNRRYRYADLRMCRIGEREFSFVSDGKLRRWKLGKESDFKRWRELSSALRKRGFGA